MNQPLVILASASPRRVELLGQLGVTFEQRPANIDETRLPGEPPANYVQRLALGKAETALAKCNEAVVVGSDTVVVLGDTVFGKPTDAEHHAQMFAQLSGRTHHVLTAVAVISGTHREQVLSQSSVTFAQTTSADVSRYWRTGEPQDKAGGYAIQGLGALFVTELAGSYSGVMGLPLRETALLLARFDCVPWLSKENV